MFIPDPGSDFFPSWIPDPNCLHTGSRIRIKELKYFNQGCGSGSDPDSIGSVDLDGGDGDHDLGDLVDAGITAPEPKLRLRSRNYGFGAEISAPQHF